MIFLKCMFASGFWNWNIVKMLIHKFPKKKGFYPCVLRENLDSQTFWKIVSFQCGFTGVLSNKILWKVWSIDFTRKWFLFREFYTWISKLEFWENVDPHISEGNDFSSVCICINFFKQEFGEYTDPHISQENDFTPVWFHIYFLYVEKSENSDLQTSQENGLSPLCNCMSIFKLRFKKILIYSFHKKLVSLQWMFSCIITNWNIVKKLICAFHKRRFPFQCVLKWFLIVNADT